MALTKYSMKNYVLVKQITMWNIQLEINLKGIKNVYVIVTRVFKENVAIKNKKCLKLLFA